MIGYDDDQHLVELTDTFATDYVAPAPTRAAAKGPHTKATIRAPLERSDRAVERAIVVLYERQTAEEQAMHDTVEPNGVGFSGCDAELLSSFAVRLNGGRRLTPGQMVWARKKVLKYSNQLAKVANARAEAN